MEPGMYSRSVMERGRLQQLSVSQVLFYFIYLLPFPLQLSVCCLGILDACGGFDHAMVTAERWNLSK